jgi:hypothetical protein
MGELLASDDLTYVLNTNRLKTLLNLGRTPFVVDSRGLPQCGLNLRFIFRESENPRNREILRRAFGNDAIRFNNSNRLFFPQKSSKTTPFRTAFNAGDPNNTVNSAPDKSLLVQGSNQINRPMLHGSRLSLGDGLSSRANGSYYTGNPRFVYDGSDYTRFKKLSAINRNYKDITFGGDQHNASQTTIARNF